MGFHLQPTAARESRPASVDNNRETAKNEVPEFFTVNSGRRFYSPELGRWLSRDPIGEEGGVNVFGFVRNGPVGRWDMLGMEEGCGCDVYEEEADKRCTTQLIEAFAPVPLRVLVMTYSAVFHPACTEHDRCYASCGKGKGTCDKLFLRDMRNICDRMPGLLGALDRSICRAMASAYYEGVRQFGDTPLALSQRYSRLQEEARKKCCCECGRGTNRE